MYYTYLFTYTYLLSMPHVLQTCVLNARARFLNRRADINLIARRGVCANSVCIRTHEIAMRSSALYICSIHSILRIYSKPLSKMYAKYKTSSALSLSFALHRNRRPRVFSGLSVAAASSYAVPQSMHYKSPLRDGTHTFRTPSSSHEPKHVLCASTFMNTTAVAAVLYDKCMHRVRWNIRGNLERRISPKISVTQRVPVAVEYVRLCVRGKRSETRMVI